ncbi:MAG: TIR domain-containing protein [Gammaproteobacteria bacterium]|nr:TIR domain-containing protein [Gammaproteobacteria bacterium]MCF6259716.1 TIR domain-containing protein [Gammaproteobacteria bacterium]
MDSINRKKISVISKYAIENFSEGDWLTLGQITGKVKDVTEHPRLFRSLSFGDDDYDYCVAEILELVFSQDISMIAEVVDHFDIDLWYQQKNPEKYQRVFVRGVVSSADFWKVGYVKLFVSHLSSNRKRMSHLKASLANWGISAFIAHEDIEASKEWRDEVEAGLETMEVMVAVVEPKFKESDWCAQEVGFALGRKIDIIPLKAGLDPFGFFGKYQGIQIKGKTAETVASDITQVLLKKPKHRDKCLQSLGNAFSTLQSSKKIELINILDSWSIVTDAQIKTLFECSSLSSFEKDKLKNLIARVGAFDNIEVEKSIWTEFDDIPF